MKTDIYMYHGPKPTFLEVFMVNNLVFRWPKPLFFMVFGAHGMNKISRIANYDLQMLKSQARQRNEIALVQSSGSIPH